MEAEYTISPLVAGSADTDFQWPQPRPAVLSPGTAAKPYPRPKAKPTAKPKAKRYPRPIDPSLGPWDPQVNQRSELNRLRRNRVLSRADVSWTPEHSSNDSTPRSIRRARSARHVFQGNRTPPPQRRALSQQQVAMNASMDRLRDASRNSAAAANVLPVEAEVQSSAAAADNYAVITNPGASVIIDPGASADIVPMVHMILDTANGPVHGFHVVNRAAYGHNLTPVSQHISAAASSSSAPLPETVFPVVNVGQPSSAAAAEQEDESEWPCPCRELLCRTPNGSMAVRADPHVPYIARDLTQRGLAFWRQRHWHRNTPTLQMDCGGRNCPLCPFHFRWDRVCSWSSLYDFMMPGGRNYSYAMPPSAASMSYDDAPGEPEPPSTSAPSALMVGGRLVQPPSNPPSDDSISDEIFVYPDAVFAPSPAVDHPFGLVNSEDGHSVESPYVEHSSDEASEAENPRTFPAAIARMHRPDPDYAPFLDDSDLSDDDLHSDSSEGPQPLCDSSSDDDDGPQPLCDSSSDDDEPVPDFISSDESQAGSDGSSDESRAESSGTEDFCPALPREPSHVGAQPHRVKNPDHAPPIAACIARKVPRSEYTRVAAAKAAMDKEWNKLANLPRGRKGDKGVGVWDITKVRHAHEVRAEAKSSGKQAHFGRVVELCMEKGSELPAGSPGRKYKGRAVFLGDQVKDEMFDYAEFQDLSSSPPSMEASRAIDAMGCFPGYSVMTSDAIGAYTQSYLDSDIPTWVALPKDRWPKSWHGKYTNPIVPLVLSLYGHPDSGGYWEEHCNERVEKCGWVAVSWEWQSVFYHPDTKSMLLIYVDDFKLAAPKQHQKRLWDDLRKHIEMEAPTTDLKFLGCNQQHFTAKVNVVAPLLEQDPMYHPRLKARPNAKGDANPNDAAPAGTVPFMYDRDRTVTGHLTNMQSFFEACITRFCDLTGTDPDKARPADTPFPDEAADACCVTSDESDHDSHLSAFMQNIVHARKLLPHVSAL